MFWGWEGRHDLGQLIEAGGLPMGPYCEGDEEEGVSSGIRKELKMKMQSCNSLESKKTSEKDLPSTFFEI